MKQFSLLSALLFAGLFPASAQLTVQVLQDQEQFLPGESLQTAVRITNRSGQTLRLGKEDNWLTFSIESPDGLVVNRLGEVPVAGEFVLESSKMATKRVDLMPYFALNQPGRYSIIATVRIPAWGDQAISQPKNFDIIQGAQLWQQEFGVPKKATDTNVIPEIRKYILQQANYIKGELRLYLRLTDATGERTFRVFSIGRMLSFSRPEPQLDKLSNLHLLFANGPHSFNYVVFNTDGELLARQTYDYSNNSRPRLRPDEDGKISVTGGSRRITANDFPAPEPLSVQAPQK